MTTSPKSENANSHSPGPWSDGGYAQQPGSVVPVRQIRAADEDLVCEIAYPEWENHQANARLIIAAPDLLEALQMLLKEPLGDFTYNIRDDEMLDWHGPRVTNWSQGVVKAQAAVAKAEGRSSG